MSHLDSVALSSEDKLPSMIDDVFGAAKTAGHPLENYQSSFMP
jgi:hypothetical protein